MMINSDRQNMVGEEQPEIEFNDVIVDELGEDDLHVMEEPFNPAHINIISKQDTLRNVIDRLKHNEIDMATDFQRHANLWDTQKMSRLIESILIRFPLPAFYFDASDDENWLIVDGLQRLSSIRKFVIEEDDRRKLRLRGLEYLKDFNGLTYSELPRTYKRRIDECAITLFLIQPGTPEEVKYSIFRRINTGGLELSDQEIRNAMAKPEIREFLRKLASDEYLLKTIGDQTKRMVDQELVLRFLAFYSMDYDTNTKNITNFLDDMVERLGRAKISERNAYEKNFRLAIKRCWDIFGETAFEKQTFDKAQRRRRKSSTLFEVWSVALANLTETEMVELIQKAQLLREWHVNLMSTDNEYFRAITFSTQKREHFRIRRDKVYNLIQGALLA